MYNNKRLNTMLDKAKVNSLPHGIYWIDCFYGKKIHKTIAPCITTRTNLSNNDFIVSISYPVKRKVIGWTRDDKGAIVNWHDVKYANTICPAKRDDTENYIMENIGTQVEVRRLTPKECFRLMGVDDKDTDKMAKKLSKSQMYKLAGNAIVVDVLSAIFTKMFIDNTIEEKQMKLF